MQSNGIKLQVKGSLTINAPSSLELEETKATINRSSTPESSPRFETRIATACLVQIEKKNPPVLDPKTGLDAYYLDKMVREFSHRHAPFDDTHTPL